MDEYDIILIYKIQFLFHDFITWWKIIKVKLSCP